MSVSVVASSAATRCANRLNPRQTSIPPRTALAASYVKLVHEANDTHEAAVTAANNEIKGTASGFATDAYKIARDAHQAAELAANDAADAAIDEATDEAKELKDRLIAATKKVTAQRTAEAVKGVESAINAIRKQMSDLKSDPTADLNSYQTHAGHATIPFGTTELTGFLSLDFLNGSVRDSAQAIQTSMTPSPLMALFGLSNSFPGPDASGLVQAFLGMSTGRTQIVFAGVSIGSYDILDGNVYRTVPDGSGGLKKGVKSMAAVQAAMSSYFALTATATNWDSFFGGAPPTGDEYKDILHQALNFFVSDDKLAAPGGVGSDILIAAEIGFGIASFVDPIGIADAGSGRINLSQGNVSAAFIDFGSIAVPFGADKLLRAAKKAPVSPANILSMAADAKYTINKAGLLVFLAAKTGKRDAYPTFSTDWSSRRSLDGSLPQLARAKLLDSMREVTDACRSKGSGLVKP